MICLSWLNVICSSILLVCMIRLIFKIIIIFYLQLFWINSYGTLLIFNIYEACFCSSVDPYIYRYALQSQRSALASLIAYLDEHYTSLLSSMCKATKNLYYSTTQSMQASYIEIGAHYDLHLYIWSIFESLIRISLRREINTSIQ
jgi:hypothetical protein